MKSYFLTLIASRDAAIAALNAALPEANETWLLKDATSDVIAYFYLAEPECMTPDWTIVADLRGRHYDRDAEVISVLEKLKAQLGGMIKNDA